MVKKTAGLLLVLMPRHCEVCGRFVSTIRMFSSDVGGMLAITGRCKHHGEQCLDMYNWDFEHFGA